MKRNILLCVALIFSMVAINAFAVCTPTQLTDNDYDDYDPQINVNGYITWFGNHNGRDREIFLNNGTTTTQLTDNTHGDQAPQINSNGQVVWFGYGIPGLNAVIFHYDGTATTTYAVILNYENGFGKRRNTL